MRMKLLVLAVASLTLTGCWHVTVTHGTSPSPTVVEKGWQSTWIYGLVPPPVVNVKDQCRNGVSKVETVHSPANVAASVGLTIITLGLGGWIWTPMSAKVTCSAR